MTAPIIHDGPLIIGGGLAGLSAALEAGPRPTLVVTPMPLLQACSSAWAQGGVAAALGDDDSAALHAKDTALAGAGLVEPLATRTLTDDGRETVEWLAGLGPRSIVPRAAALPSAWRPPIRARASPASAVTVRAGPSCRLWSRRCVPLLMSRCGRTDGFAA